MIEQKEKTNIYILLLKLKNEYQKLDKLLSNFESVGSGFARLRFVEELVGYHKTTIGIARVLNKIFVENNVYYETFRNDTYSIFAPLESSLENLIASLQKGAEIQESALQRYKSYLKKIKLNYVDKIDNLMGVINQRP